MQVYLTTLEMTKAKVADQAELYSPSAPVASAITNFAGGAIASLVTQSVVVPIDVVSQRLMVAGKLPSILMAATPHPCNCPTCCAVLHIPFCSALPHLLS